MSDKLQLTYKELELIIGDDLERFETLYNDIPKEGHSSHYIEDDGRQLRFFHFRDKETQKDYSFSYVWSSEWGYDLPESFLGDAPEDIDFVTKSVIYPEVVVVPKEPELTPAEKADKALWAKYEETASQNEMRKMDTKLVPKDIIKDVINFINTEKFSMLSLRQKLIPVCIDYKIEHKSFWQYIQVKRGVWKKPKI